MPSAQNTPFCFLCILRSGTKAETRTARGLAVLSGIVDASQFVRMHTTEEKFKLVAHASDSGTQETKAGSSWISRAHQC